MSGFLGVGHGRKDSGVYDPGAVADDGTQEHVQAHRVVEVIAQALARSGEPAFVERDSGAGHDPNFQGSVRKVNEGGFAYAVEVHFDWAQAPNGGFGLYISEGGANTLTGQSMADAIRHRWLIENDLPARPNTRRTDLYFLRYTKPPSIIWECGPIRTYDEGTIVKMGEAIAAGLCDFVQRNLNPSISYVPRSTEQPIPAPPPDCSQVESERDSWRAKAEEAQERLNQIKAIVG